jgi:hypothetical protein
MEQLQKQDWVVETSIFGSAFHVSTLREVNAVAEINTVLAKQHITPRGIRPILPSLEDAFIHVIAQHDTQRAGTLT